MRLLYYIIFICLFISGCIPSKEISIKKKEINPDGLYHSMTEYIISNNTDTNYYTWVDYNSYYSKDSIEVNLSHYLFIFHGDYNLGALLTDNVFFNDGFYPEIGVSFLKEIGPGESFTYLVTGDIKDRDSFKNHIYFIDESRFLTVVGSVINTEVSYKANEIKVNAPLQEIR